MNKDLFLASLNDVKAALDGMRKDTSLVFTVFSDLHTRSVEDATTQQLLEALDAVGDVIKPDAVINLGDNLAMLGRNNHITNDQLVATLSNLFDAMKQAANCPLLLINGNHDAVGTDFFKPELWNGVVKGKYDDGLAHYGEEGSYFYVDFDRAGTRLVFLSLPSDSDLDGEYPRPLWEFGENQLEWLRTEALSTDHTVLLFCHEPLYYAYHGQFGPDDTPLEVWDGEKVTTTPIIQVCGWIGDRDKLVAAVEDSGRVAACFSGHTHADSLWAPHEQIGEDTNPLPCYQVVTRNPIVNPWDHEDLEVGVMLDILVWDAADKTIHMLRVGDGEDREVPCLLEK